MSFVGPKEVIAEGDTVVLYLTPAMMHTIEAVRQIRNKKNEMIDYVFQTSFGALKVSDLIGERYGARVQLTKGWAHVLQPNPELWTQTLPHRTQILYTPDISMILYQLEVRPGSIVIESGTGSGSLSHYFLRAIRPSGHLHTFDFHEERCAKAREEFTAHGLGDSVTVRQRDVCEQGFGPELDGKADAVFLDLPAPQLAIPHAAKAIRDEGKCNPSVIMIRIVHLPAVLLTIRSLSLCSHSGLTINMHPCSYRAREMIYLKLINNGPQTDGTDRDARHRVTAVVGPGPVGPSIDYLSQSIPNDSEFHVLIEGTGGNRGGRICSFSPCIEQSMRVCDALAEHGFIEVQNLEVLQIEDIVRTRNVPVMELEFLKTKYPVINVTVICRKEHYTSQDKQDAPAQCPKYETGVRWSPADLIYIEYDSYRYELRSCAFMNGTHAYRGYMMLTDLFEPRSRPRLKELPIWKQRVNDPDALLFRYDGDCEKCNFRNEYVGVARPLRPEQDDQPLNVAEPFCVDGHLTMLTSDPRSSSDDKDNSFTFGSLSVPLALLVVTLIVIVMMALRSMCIRKSATRVVSPELSERSRKCSLVVERLSAY
uniref:tRNA (adenine(58)-N(1))-methyltransferase n=1 Tax=Anopheles albimanus TaxID=7167 RepID=A0A182FL55_ANOAL